ncbi:hypothetical protein AT00_08910 [Pseudoalteromonas lipolytica SCSIO 04301]|uniref:hypothetical protein n=1 Tax=Pseudoalteromonas lipolytica TaxID=570156 RepID=UPI00045137A4|nr:hypothetical protein [Pseudoalteromonas lipolytica]EWH06625.1 hypothetical protein AT00_08910 [Pseudoalteromonas lipolytica SCSIO 04301]
MPDYSALNALLTALSEHIEKTEIELASQLLVTIDKKLRAWCESTTPPTEKELLSIQTKILAATARLKNARDKTQTELINQRKSQKAISKYKATKR